MLKNETILLWDLYKKTGKYFSFSQWKISALFSETGFHYVSQAGLELAVYLRLTLNSGSYCVSLPYVRIVGDTTPAFTSESWELVKAIKALLACSLFDLSTVLSRGMDKLWSMSVHERRLLCAKMDRPLPNPLCLGNGRIPWKLFELKCFLEAM